ncbi:hypothetical protein N7526_009692 [Penicillium atrosanguineum]|nr:hypothetical protein N7526_009692 [Penicillium atrosanguineum]
MDYENRSKQDSVQNRLWWSILLRDRSLSLGLRRRAKVLSLELGMIKDLPKKEEFAAEINGSHVYDSNTKDTLFQVFQKQCQLAILLTEMVSLVFGTHGLSLPVLTPESLHDTLLILNKTKTSLALWKRASSISSFTKANVHNAVVNFAQFTMMHYHGARMDLAHYEAFLIEKHSNFVGPDYAYRMSHVGNILLDATTKLVSIMQYFNEKGHIQSFPLALLGHVAMPLVFSAINFKLSSSEPEMIARRECLQLLGELMSHSRRFYYIGDFISSQTDVILKLAYLTSQEIFAQDTPDSLSESHREHGYSLTDTARSRSEIPIVKGPAKNWHDAFLRYPRAYLLISTTIDYFFSVGRLPQDNSLPELVRSMPPMGRIKLPWASQTEFSGKKLKRKQSKLDIEKVSQPPIWSGPVSLWQPEKRARLSVMSSTAPHSSEDQTDHQDNTLNLDYLPISALFNAKGLCPDPKTELPASESGENFGVEEEEDPWDLTEATIAYDEFISTL